MAMLMGLATQSKRVDAHQHFWRYSGAEYGWIDEEMASIRRDLLPRDLKPLLEQAGINATIAVQARQSLEETEWLLQLADQNPWIEGVVGWVPLVDQGREKLLEKLAANPRLKGVRHVLQGEADEYFDRPDFNAGISLLRQFHLRYDVLIHESQLPAAIALLDRHPGQPFVLDHLAKPRIAARQLEPWRSHLRTLAKRPHVWCKLSGMVTEADWKSWKETDLEPYYEAALEAFGPSRLMFGSDWPVCTVAGTYGRWLALVEEWLASLSKDEQAMIMGETAANFYKLSATNDDVNSIRQKKCSEDRPE